MQEVKKELCVQMIELNWIMTKQRINDRDDEAPE